MSLTITYNGLSSEELLAFKQDLAGHETFFFQNGDETVLLANGNMEAMLAILNITVKYRHSAFLLRQ